MKKIFNEENKEIGSGNASDSKTASWLAKNLDNVFGYPNFVRFSWLTIKNLLGNNNIVFEFFEETKIKE